MGKALRIGIITAYPQEDWHSRQLIAAAEGYGEAVVIRPEILGARLTSSGVTVFAENGALPAVDGYVLARGFGEKGNSDFLVPVYQIMQRSGSVLVNNIDALLIAIDKFETSYRLQQAGVPTPHVVVAQEVETARAVLHEWGVWSPNHSMAHLGWALSWCRTRRKARPCCPSCCSATGRFISRNMCRRTEIFAPLSWVTAWQPVSIGRRLQEPGRPILPRGPGRSVPSR